MRVHDKSTYPPLTAGQQAVIDALQTRITELEVLRDSLATVIALLVRLPDGESGALYQLVERCYYWYGVDSNVPVTLGDISKPVCGECHLKPGEICDICGALQPLPATKPEPPTTLPHEYPESV